MTGLPPAAAPEDHLRAFAELMAPGEHLGSSRGELSLHLAISVLAREAIDRVHAVHAPVDSSDPGVLAANVGTHVAKRLTRALTVAPVSTADVAALFRRVLRAHRVDIEATLARAVHKPGLITQSLCACGADIENDAGDEGWPGHEAHLASELAAAMAASRASLEPAQQEKP